MTKTKKTKEKTKVTKKVTKPRKSKWSEVEDFYLKEQAVNFSDLELANKLNKTEKEVAKRIVELGIDLETLMQQKRKELALKGVQVGSGNDPNANIIAMTGARSAQDDTFAGVSPFDGKHAPPRNTTLDQFRTDLVKRD